MTADNKGSGNSEYGAGRANGNNDIPIGKMNQRRNKYKFTSDGHTYPVIFKPDGSAFEINWGGGERFGPWVKAK